MAIVVVSVALLVGGVVLALTGLSQVDVVHQIILAGMGSALVASGLVLLLVEVFAYAKERTGAGPKTK